MKAIDLSLSAGKKRQSARTGFLHSGDTIPVYENFCYAFALFRHKTTESVLEGKALVEKLLAFQLDDGNFPAHLHEFPKAWDFQLGSKIFPALFHILDRFHTVLPSSYKDTLRNAMKKISLPSTPLNPTSAKEWFDCIAADQLTRKNGSYPIPYHKELQLFLGPHKSQEKFEPEPLPIEYILAESRGFSPRLQRDHLHQLHSAMLLPFSSALEETALPFWQEDTSRRIVWKGNCLHSLYAPLKKIELPEIGEIGRDDLFEALCFCNLSSETKILINGEKGMVFQLGDQISICTPETTLSLSFTLLKGQGSFCGHISRSNRPKQIACQGEQLYDAFDYQIGLRTLRREGPCTLEINIK